MSTSVRPAPGPVIQPSTDFPTPDDGEPIHSAPLKLAWFVVAGALVVAAIVGYALAHVL